MERDLLAVRAPDREAVVVRQRERDRRPAAQIVAPEVPVVLGRSRASSRLPSGESPGRAGSRRDRGTARPMTLPVRSTHTTACSGAVLGAPRYVGERAVGREREVGRAAPRSVPNTLHERDGLARDGELRGFERHGHQRVAADEDEMARVDIGRHSSRPRRRSSPRPCRDRARPRVSAPSSKAWNSTAWPPGSSTGAATSAGLLAPASRARACRRRRRRRAASACRMNR